MQWGQIDLALRMLFGLFGKIDQHSLNGGRRTPPEWSQYACFLLIDAESSSDWLVAHAALVLQVYLHQYPSHCFDCVQQLEIPLMTNLMPVFQEVVVWALDCCRMES